MKTRRQPTSEELDKLLATIWPIIVDYPPTEASASSETRGYPANSRRPNQFDAEFPSQGQHDLPVKLDPLLSSKKS